MSKKYVIVNQNVGFVQCMHITDNYFEAVGRISCLVADDDAHKTENGYKIKTREDFVPLECDTGWGWFRVFEHESEGGKTWEVNEDWLLLVHEEETNEIN